MTNINEEEKVEVTISIPTKDIALLAPIDYEKLTSRVYNELDLGTLASNVVEEIDLDDIVDKIDMADLASNFKDQIDITDYIDLDDVANDAAYKVDFTERIGDLLEEYSAEKTDCSTNNAATRVIIDAIRYDLMCYYYEKDGRSKDIGTITDLLRKIILKEMAKAGYPEKVVIVNNLPVTGNLKPSYTLDEIYNTISKIPSMNSELMNSILAALPKE